MSHDPTMAARPVGIGLGLTPVTRGAPATESQGDAGTHAPVLVPERRQREGGTRRAIRAIKSEYAGSRTVVECFSDALTRLASSTRFLVAHALWFATWVLWNSGQLGARPFDPFPFGLLTMVVSLEAIFLSIFVLMSQARESAIAELREELTLQVNLRVEEEVTKTLQLVAGLYTRMGYRVSDDAELEEMLRPLDAAEIERSLIEQIRESTLPLSKRARLRAG